MNEQRQTGAPPSRDAEGGRDQAAPETSAVAGRQAEREPRARAREPVQRVQAHTPLRLKPQIGELRWWMGVPTLHRYSASLVVLVAAILTRLSIEPWIHGLYPFFTAYAAVVVSGWLFGVGPALLTMVLAYVTHLLLFAAAEGFPFPMSHSVAIGSAMYFITGMLICMLAQARQESEIRYLKHVKQAQVEQLRLRALLEVIPEGVLIVEMPSERVQEVSRAGADLAGMDQAFIMSMGVHELQSKFRSFAPDGQALEGMDRPLTRMLRTGEPVFDREVILERPDGTRIPIMMNGAPIFDEAIGPDGKRVVTGGVMVYRNISKRKKVMAELAESAVKYQLLFDQAPFPKWLLDLESLRFLEVNDAAVKSYGYTPDEFRKMTLSDLRAPGMPPSELELHHERVEHFEGSIATRHVTKDGELIDVEMTARDIDIQHKNAGPGGTMLVESFDLTDLARSREELARKAQELERSNADLEQFAHAAAHDLKEPLRGLVLYSSFLTDDFSKELPDEAKRMIATISRLAQRGTDLVDALLDFSQAGRAVLHPTDCDLNALVDEVLEGLRTLLDEQHVLVSRPTRLPIVRCDRVQVGRVLTNLITNAIKYNRSDPKRIEIGMASDPRAGINPVIYVRDNGIGIKVEHQERIFKMFRRLHAADAYGGGTGAGLALVDKLVRKHGGEVWVTSSAGEGSTFYFTLAPASTSPDRVEPARTTPDGPPSAPEAGSPEPR